MTVTVRKQNTMRFGLCYIPDYHQELSGSWQDWYDNMIAEVRLAEALGFDGAWFAEHRVAGFAFGSPAMFIAACARETHRIRLGCSVSLLPLNSAVRTAEDYAMAAVRTEATYRWAGENGFNLLTAPFFFTDHREQQALLVVYRDSLRAHGHDPASKQVMAVYHMYCAARDADIADFADPALRRYQAFTKATDLTRQAYRDPVAYKDWKGFFENRDTITLEQMKAERAVIGQPEECIAKLRLLSERFGITYFSFEVNFGALPHDEVMRCVRRFAEQVMPELR